MNVSGALRNSLSSEWLHLGESNGAEFWNLSNKNKWDEGDLLKIGTLPNSHLSRIEILLDQKRNSKIMKRGSDTIFVALNEINSNFNFTGKALVEDGIIRYEYITPQYLGSTALTAVIVDRIKTAYTRILDL